MIRVFGVSTHAALPTLRWSGECGQGRPDVDFFVADGTFAEYPQSPLEALLRVTYISSI